MKLLNFKKDNKVRLGIKTEKGILDVTSAGAYFHVQVPNSMEELIYNDDAAILQKLAELASAKANAELYFDENDIEFLPSIINPEKIICVGLNYQSHVEEAKIADTPESPILFSKFNNALAAHNETIILPSIAQKIDYEAELVVVIGKEAKDVAVEDALSYVWGYSAGNDLSARDLQFKTGQWLIGKTLDGFAPVGPYLVTKDEFNPMNATIECRVNGELRQASNTKHMIFNCATIISYISQHMTLKPGDVIFTGTPEGVILGYPEDEQKWLTAGDVIEVTIEGIGKLKNTLQ